MKNYLETATEPDHSPNESDVALISASVNVGESSGRVTGIEIHRLNVGLMTKATPPSLESVKSYLEKVKDQDSKPDVNSELDEKQREKLQTLWNMPFYVHPYGQVAGQSMELGEQLNDLFSSSERSTNNIIILAEPGTGKTPALLRLRSCTARNSLIRLASTENRESAQGPLLGKRVLIPIYMELRNLGGDILTLITAAYNKEAIKPIRVMAAEELVSKYSCLLLFDGIDELNVDHQRGEIQTIRQFIDSHPNVRFVFTSRIGSYNNQLGRATLLELDLLQREQIEKLLGNEVYSELSPSLQYLVPYRLMLEKVLRQPSNSQELKSKGQLIQYFVRSQCGLDPSGKQNANWLTERLSQWLAFYMQMNHAYFYSEQQVGQQIGEYLQKSHEQITWREALSLLQQSKVFDYEPEHSHWCFKGNNTQAYFAAAAMAENNELLTLALEHIADPVWAEPFEILVGICKDPTALLFDLVDREPRVAAHCYSFARQPILPRFSDALLDALLDALGSETSDGREDIAKFLSRHQLTDFKGTERILLQALQREWRAGVIRALTQALLPVVDPLPKDFQEDFTKFHSKAIGERLKMVVQLWRTYVEGTRFANTDSEEKRRWLEKCTDYTASVMDNSRESELVRGVAAIVLGAIGTDDALKLLLKRWHNAAKTELLGWCITESLAHFDNQPKSIKVVAQKIVNRCYKNTTQGKVKNSENQRNTPTQEEMRVWSLYLLGYLGTRDEATSLLALLECALNPNVEKSSKARGYAAQAIGQLQPEKGKQTLQEALNHEEDLWVVRKIVQALAHVGTPDTIPILENYLRTVRVKARKTVLLSIAALQQKYEGSK